MTVSVSLSLRLFVGSALPSPSHAAILFNFFFALHEFTPFSDDFSCGFGGVVDVMVGWPPRSSKEAFVRCSS